MVVQELFDELDVSIDTCLKKLINQHPIYLLTVLFEEKTALFLSHNLLLLLLLLLWDFSYEPIFIFSDRGAKNFGKRSQVWLLWLQIITDTRQ